jgi:hypothetical protein
MHGHQGSTNQRLQSVQVPRIRLLLGVGGLMVAGGAAWVYVWGVGIRRPLTPPAAALPASARVLLQPFRRDAMDLTLAAHGELQYRIGMDAGATLVYSWSTGHRPVSYQFAGQKPGRAGEAHGAFLAQSSGWYTWHCMPYDR